MFALEVSVIICTHNPRPKYLRRVLDALDAQLLPKERWELILVDNASRSRLARDWDLSWHPNAQHIREDELGVAAARQRGMRNSKADLIVFVDDDNVLSCDYLSVALQSERAFPKLGTWGAGSIAPEFEREPAEHLKPFLCYLALRDNKERYWSNVITCGNSLPVGAGLCVRRQVAAEYLNFCKQPSSIKITGRKGNSLLGHEDYEICFVGCELGLGMGVFPELRMTHLIPKERTSDEYFLRLLQGCQISGLLIDFKWPRTPASHQLVDQLYMRRNFPSSPFSIRGLLTISENALMKRGFDRRAFFANLQGTIAARRMLMAAGQAPTSVGCWELTRGQLARGSGAARLSQRY